MIEHAFSPEMMYEREKQLITALLDCAGVYYDINFTKDKILGNPIQIVDGKPYPILELIGKEKNNCTYTEIIDYWKEKMPVEESEPYAEFSKIDNIFARYKSGERIISHKFWTYDVLGNSMLAEQKIVLYEDITCGDLLGLAYVSNGSATAVAKSKEAEIGKLYTEASHRIEVLQHASTSLPGGYHRCSLSAGYPFLFVSHSFEDIVGYTSEQLEKELNNNFINLIFPEDFSRFASLEEGIRKNGSADVTYRIRRRDGEIRWVQESSLLVDWEGTPCLQCTIADITDFVSQQERLARENTELEELAENIPCGYHRCTTDNGFKLDFVSESFLEAVGYEKHEIMGMPFIELVAPEDREFFMSHEPELSKTGRIDLAYRIVRKNGDRRWIKDSTQRVEKGGSSYYQCILVDITDFVNEQENMVKKNMELMEQNILFESMEQNMPGGYHRCDAKEGCPITYIGNHFTDIVGFTKEEIEKDFGNIYYNLVLEEDLHLMSTYADMIKMRGKGNSYDTSVYRLKHKDGGYRWVTDSTMFVDRGENSFFQAIISDITEYIDGLDAAKKEAEASNLAKSTFLFNASHDIRTPMNAIKGFAHIIKENSSNEKCVSETIKKIEAASDTLMTLMNDILDLARIERGKEEINIEPVCFYDHGRTLYELFESSMKEAGLDFRMEGKLEHDHIMCDPLKLTRIGMNMLSNAKKFTPTGGSVVFGAEELGFDGEKVTYKLYTKDTGIGMSDEFKKRAFEQFEREKTSTESGVSGSGLGLAIIKKLVELMGGKVDIKSEIGSGTEIYAILSFDVVDEEKFTNKDKKSGSIDLSGKRILLVEDNEFNREIARYMLEGMNLLVEEAPDGAFAIDMISGSNEGYYDLILMDIQMPRMNGIDATREIRSMKNEDKAKIPIIAMTANAFEEDKEKCISAGMNGHISKPIDSEKVTEELRRIFTN